MSRLIADPTPIRPPHGCRPRMPPAGPRTAALRPLVFVGGRAALTAARLEAAAPELPRGLRRVPSARLRPRLAGGEVYTDDRAPVEWLIDSSLLEYAGG